MCSSTRRWRGSSPRMRGTRGRRGAQGHRRGLIPAYAGNTGSGGKNAYRLWAHPRVCGEHFSAAWLLSQVRGSSPRMRGTRGLHIAHMSNIRLIPAYAGNTRRGRWCLRLCWAHPRVCGEHFQYGQAPMRQTGSSPRMRGTHTEVVWQPDDAGLIPAYAGNTPGTRPAGTCTTAHPRVCGEHSSMICRSQSATGSSPRMRGTPDRGGRVGGVRRLIPAYAGNTHGHPLRVGRCQAHPRVCGEHRSWSTTVPSPVGSSPRMRGTLLARLRDILARRLIPAYAGNTGLGGHWLSGGGAHPRVCGEHWTSRAGSPKKTWLIPAYAGNTLSRLPDTVDQWAHPRVCGEHQKTKRDLRLTRGSSPRMRGTQ